MIKITDQKTVNLDKDLHKRLKLRATKKGKLLREELTDILKKELEIEDDPND